MKQSDLRTPRTSVVGVCQIITGGAGLIFVAVCNFVFSDSLGYPAWIISSLAFAASFIARYFLLKKLGFGGGAK